MPLFFQGSKVIEEGTTAASAIESEVKALLFRNFFALLEQKNIPYAILSNYFAYPEDIHSDIDFVVPEPHRESIPPLLQAFCTENDAHLLQISEYNNTSAYSCFVAILRNSLPIHLRFDVCSDDHRAGKLILPWQFLIDGRIRYLNSFFVPAPEKCLIHYLVKHSEKRFIERQHLRTLYKWYAAAPAESEEMLRRYWPSEYQQILSCILTQVNPSPEWVEAWSKNVHLKDARQTFSERGLQSMKEVRRKLRRIRRPMGFFISFLGPDGCGKSTAITGVKRALQPAFAQTAEFHLLPRVLHRGRKDNDTSHPHAKTPRGPITSLAKTSLWFADLWVGYWIKLLPKMVRSTLIIFDRYIHDLQVDRNRYRYSGPQWWPRFLAKLSPKPDLWILLDAPPEVLWRRKAELTREESARQRAAYRELIAPIPNAIMIDANQPPEIVVAAVCSEVFHRLETRTAQRYRLPKRDFSR